MQQTNKNFSTRLLKPVRIVTTISSVGLTMLAYLMFFPMQNRGEAASAVTGAATASTTSLTLSSSSNSANIAITPNSIGVFAMSDTTNEAEFNVTTNNYTGYTLSIAADDDDGNLVNNVNDSTVYNIGSISVPIDQSTFDTAAYNNKWGYKPSKYVDANDIVVDNTGDTALFLPSPTTVATVLDRTTEANVVANIYTIGLGARVDQNMVSGTYSKTFSLLATANPIVYTIEYNSNTADTVANMPATQGGDTSITSITLSGNTPSRDSYNFLGWCNTQPIANDGVDSCPGATFQPGAVYGIDQTTANTTTLYAMWKIDAFTQTTEVRYENADGTWGDYSVADTQTVNSGSSYSWSTAQIDNFDSAAYQAASVSSYTVTEAHTNQVSIYRNTFTCTKQYRLENADGTWGAYTTESTDTVRYGSSCSYTKTVTDYKAGGASATNGAQGSTSASNITANITLSLDFYRNTYTLTVSAGSNTSSPTGSGTYRWGQAVSVSVIKATNVTCTYYATPTWTQSGTAGTFSSTIGTSTTFTMGKGNATVTATSAAQSQAIYVALSYRGSGVNGIIINGTEYTGTHTYLACGTYNISGSYASGYEFDSWSAGGVSGAVVVANPASATTTVTISGGMGSSLALTGKQSCVSTITGTTMQSFSVGSTNYCEGATGTLTDSRSGNKSYTVAKIGSLIWMTKNLDLPGGTALTAADSNVSAGCALGGTNNCTLPASSTTGFSKYDTAYVYNSNSTTCGDGSPCYSYYSYAAATAGTNPSSGDATSDICPKGWRLPTSAELITLTSTYTTGADLTASPFYGVYAGYYDSSSFNYGGSEGYYWSSTPGTVSGAPYLYFTSYYAVVYGGGRKEHGHSIRCVAK